MQICPSSGLLCDCGVAPAENEVRTDREDKLGIGGKATHSRPTAEPIFPSELKSRAAAPLYLPGSHATWHR